MAQHRAIKVLMEDLGVTMEEAVQMVNQATNNKLRTESESDNEMEVQIGQANQKEALDTGTDEELLPPEQEVEKEIPQSELDQAKQIFGNVATEDFMSVDRPAGQTLTLKAADFPQLAQENIGYDTFFVVRGPLVAKQEDTLSVGIGKAVMIKKTG